MRQLNVTFGGGTSGKVGMQEFLSSSKVNGTVFGAPAVFAEARIVMGAVQWPNGADLAPAAMYEATYETGVWVVD